MAPVLYHISTFPGAVGQEPWRRGVPWGAQEPKGTARLHVTAALPFTCQGQEQTGGCWPWDVGAGGPQSDRGSPRLLDVWREAELEPKGKDR